jgi:hypothetical protein
LSFSQWRERSKAIPAHPFAKGGVMTAKLQYTVISCVVRMYKAFIRPTAFPAPSMIGFYAAFSFILNFFFRRHFPFSSPHSPA